MSLCGNLIDLDALFDEIFQFQFEFTMMYLRRGIFLWMFSKLVVIDILFFVACGIYGLNHESSRSDVPMGDFLSIMYQCSAPFRSHNVKFTITKKIVVPEDPREAYVMFLGGQHEALIRLLQHWPNNAFKEYEI